MCTTAEFYSLSGRDVLIKIDHVFPCNVYAYLYLSADGLKIENYSFGP